MSVAIYNIDNNNTIYLPVSSESFFEKYWNKAIIELNIKTLGNSIELYRSDILQILNDLDNIQNWAKNNLIGKDLDYMVNRVEYIKIELPKCWTEKYPILYMG